MSTHSKMPQLMTVRGPVPTEAAGQGESSAAWVLPHERLFHRIRDALPLPLPPEAGNSTPGGADCLAPECRHVLRDRPWALGGGNLAIEREDEVFREIEAVRGHGVLVDVTTVREGRNVAALRRVATRLDLPIVASTAVDLETIAAMPTHLTADEKSERVNKALETDILYGIDGETGPSAICAGVVHQPMHFKNTNERACEEILIRGLAMTQRRMGIALFLSFSHDGLTQGRFEDHIARWIDELMRHGAAADKLVLCSADRWTDDGMEFLVSLARRGITLSFNQLGLYTVSDAILVNPCLHIPGVLEEPPRDAVIARRVVSLVREFHFTKQILLSPGIHQRVQFRRYGGGGFGHVFDHFRQRVVGEAKLDDAEWRDLTCENALRLLTWYDPPAAAEIPKDYLRCSICSQAFEPIEGEYFTKFEFIYCGPKCLRKHSKMGFKPLSDA